MRAQSQGLLAHDAPALLTATVTHERYGPVANRFAYRLFCLRLPLSKLDTLSVWPLVIDRRGLVSLRLRDHGARDGSHPLAWIRALIEREGLAAGGEVVLQTMPRILGHGFNPVSFWYCHDGAGGLRAVLCEVNNTFGEHHNYLVCHPDGRAIAAGDTLVASKAFHVSPFFPVRGEYRFRFASSGDRHAVVIDYYEGGALRLATRIAGKALPLTSGALLTALARFPLMTLAVVGRIHWQALRLWLAGASLFRKPLPPTTEISR